MDKSVPDRTATPADILDFWFGGWPPTDYRNAWFEKNPAFDEDVRQRFGPTIELALTGGLDHWRTAPEDALALILLLDQFTRNVFRDTPKAFAGDARALDTARAMVSVGQDKTLPPLARSFVYMPFMHSETLADQDRCVTLFEAFARETGNDGNVRYAHAHRDIIARFGRFPHRNAILGRASTAEEQEFLTQPGSSF